MWNWLKDVLGINRYVVAWNFTFPNGHKYVSRDARTNTKRGAQYVARGMNRDYGAGSHWVERA